MIFTRTIKSVRNAPTNTIGNTEGKICKKSEKQTRKDGKE